MKVKKDYTLNLDVRPGDTIYQYTTVRSYSHPRISLTVLTQYYYSDWVDNVANPSVRTDIWRQNRLVRWFSFVSRSTGHFAFGQEIEVRSM